MRSRHTTLTPVSRSLAAVALLVWLAAQALCTAHCYFGVGHGESEHASCHGPAPLASHHDDEDSPGPAHDDSSTSAVCLTLKSALVNGNGPVLTQLVVHVLYVLAPVAFALDATATEPAASISRHVRPRDWVVTSEVCTGPANRSHAPPLLS